MASSEEREFDIIVFGASGFTGQFVVEELARVAKDEGGIKWAVAGRSRQKLEATLEAVAQHVGENLSHIRKIKADVNYSESLHEMCKRTKLVLNCVGPYRLYGEPVVSACLTQKTHHVDISAEHQFLETMQLKYFEKAKKAGIYIVEACGFGSIPCDMGVTFLKKKFHGDINSVETYLTLEHFLNGLTVNFGTWQSQIYDYSHTSELKGLRKQLNENIFKKEFPKDKCLSINSFLKHSTIGSILEEHIQDSRLMFKSETSKGWCIPFLGCDKSVTLRSQKFNYEFKNEKPVQLHTYIKLPSLLAAFTVCLFAIIFGILVSFKFGRTLLEKYPEVFSFGMFTRRGPTRQQATDSSFTMIFSAEGWPEKIAEPTVKPSKSMKIIIKGPGAAYITTAICMVQAGIVIIKEFEKMPFSGGVLTPGAAFGQTSLIERLQKHGIEFSVLEDIPVDIKHHS